MGRDEFLPAGYELVSRREGSDRGQAVGQQEVAPKKSEEHDAEGGRQPGLDGDRLGPNGTEAERLEPQKIGVQGGYVLCRDEQRDQDHDPDDNCPTGAPATQGKASRYVRRCADQHTGAYRRACPPRDRARRYGQFARVPAEVPEGGDVVKLPVLAQRHRDQCATAPRVSRWVQLARRPRFALGLVAGQSVVFAIRARAFGRADHPSQQGALREGQVCAAGEGGGHLLVGGSLDPLSLPFPVGRTEGVRQLPGSSPADRIANSRR